MTYKERCEGCPRIAPYQEDNIARIGTLVQMIISDEQHADLAASYDASGVPMPGKNRTEQTSDGDDAEAFAMSELDKRSQNNRAIDTLQRFCVLGALPSATSPSETHPVCTSLAAPFYRGPKHD